MLSGQAAAQGGEQLVGGDAGQLATTSAEKSSPCTLAARQNPAAGIGQAPDTLGNGGFHPCGQDMPVERLAC